MQYKKLGTSEIKVSELGYGCWPIGGHWGDANDARDIRSLQDAFERGVTFFDTAMAYGAGHSEEVIGQAFAKNRDKVKIASKIGPKCDPASPAEEAYPYEWVIECTEKSLKRLNTDYLDLQQIHTWRDHYTEESGWFRAMQKLKEDGKIRSIGVSAECWNPDGAVRIAESGKIDSVQVIYNVFDQQPIEKLFPAAIANNVGIIVRVSLFEGMLAGKIRPGHKWCEGDWRANFLREERLIEAEPHLDAIKNLCTPEYDTMAALCLKFCLSHPAVTTVIAGMRNPRHVEANCAISDGPALSQETIEALQKQAWEHNWEYPWTEKK